MEPNAQTAQRPAGFGPADGSEASCNCWHEKDDKLREMGYKIADACAMLQIKDLSITAKYGLPLERTDGKKLKRGDPTMITISFCPFCGSRLYPMTCTKCGREINRKTDAYQEYENAGKVWAHHLVCPQNEKLSDRRREGVLPAKGTQ